MATQPPTGAPSSAAQPVPMAELEALLARATGGKPPFTLHEIVGGASTRRFFRVPIAQASVIAMYSPVAESHEIEKASTRPRSDPFLDIRELLDARGVRVPALLGSAREHGLVLVEDLGQTIAQHLQRAPDDRERLYVAAVRGLARAQRALRELPDDSIVRERVFDEDLFRCELDHFREWALDARGIKLSAEDARTFERAADHLSQTIASWERGFVHRDYQSRNLMVVERANEPLQIGWIDFQDAMLGPRIYDMVALLRDSYQTFTPQFVEDRLDDFAHELGLPDAERARIGREFRLVTVQRKLKDAGRFVFIDRVRKNPSFLEFVEPTIAKARRAIAELSDEPYLAELGALFDRLFAR